MKEAFSLRTVRKKILMLSKLAGAVLIFSYIFSTGLPVSKDASFLIWLGFVFLLIIGIDFFMGRFITKPIDKLNASAKRMAGLDFSALCDLVSTDEFGELSASLNTMAENLQQALDRLEDANAQLEKDVEKERLLLAERKELVDSLSHEMKTPLGIIRAYAEGLQDEADEAKKQKYAQVIVSEVERMNDLIVALLDLSALESGAASLNISRFDFVELAETVAGRLLIDAPDTDFELQYELPEQKIFVRTDRRSRPFSTSFSSCVFAPSNRARACCRFSAIVFRLADSSPNSSVETRLQGVEKSSPAMRFAEAFSLSIGFVIKRPIKRSIPIISRKTNPSQIRKEVSSLTGRPVERT